MPLLTITQLARNLNIIKRVFYKRRLIPNVAEEPRSEKGRSRYKYPDFLAN